MSDDQEPKRPRGRFGNWRSRPLVGGPGIGERARPRPLWPPPGAEDEPYAEGMTPEEVGDVKVEAVAQGHEPDAAQMRPVIGFVVGVALIMLLALVVVTGMQAVMTGGQVQVALPPDGIVLRAVDPEDRDLPENARVRAIPDIELIELQQMERGLLGSYEWIDEGAGKARIPIERAMELLLQKGLPTLPNASQSSPEAPRPSDASSGRVVGSGQ